MVMLRGLLTAFAIRRVGPTPALLALAIVLAACGTESAVQPAREEIQPTPSPTVTVIAAGVPEPAFATGARADGPDPSEATLTTVSMPTPESPPLVEPTTIATATPTPTVDRQSSAVPPTRTASPTATSTPAPQPASTPTPSPSPEPTPVPPTPTVAPPPSTATAVPTLTATPTPEPTPTPGPTPEPAPVPTPVPVATPEPATFEVVCVFFDGEVPTSQSDEYVAIRNNGGAAGSLEGWTLLDGADGRPAFAFPDVVLNAGETIRVYTDEVHLEYGGFSFGSGSAIWNNSNPDRADLKNPDGDIVSSMSYPPGC